MRIIQPLTITIEQSDDLFIAFEEVFGVYGDGDTEIEAMEDYKSSLLDYYQLFEHRARDDEQDRIVFNHLKLYISSKDKFFELEPNAEDYNTFMKAQGIENE